MKRSVTLIVLAALAACSSRTPAGPPEPQPVALTTPQGAITATYYASPTPDPPALILVSPPGVQADAWAPLALGAQRQGYASLIVNPVPDARATLTESEWLKTFDVIRAAAAEVRARGADPDNLAIGGAGVTANLVLRFAETDPAMQAVVMLSPGLEYEGIRIETAIRAVGKRPLFIAVAEGDAYAHSSSLQLHAWAEGYCELRVYDGAAHGTDLFSTANAAEQILLWLKPILVPQPK